MIVTTLLCAIVSYHLLEMPIREGGLVKRVQARFVLAAGAVSMVCMVVVVSRSAATLNWASLEDGDPQRSS